MMGFQQHMIRCVGIKLVEAMEIHGGEMRK